MFPEIIREDVFRLETRRLWLRWPEVGDAEPPSARPDDATGDPYRNAERIASWRAANGAGTALHLALTGQGADRSVIGAVSLVPLRGRPEDCGLKLEVRLAAAVRGRGYATEAVQAAVDAAFLLTGTPLVAASSHVLDPAFRRVLEKCGFAGCGTGLDVAADGQALTASDRFRLDRKAWASLKSWRMPGLPLGQGPAECCEPAGARACMA